MRALWSKSQAEAVVSAALMLVGGWARLQQRDAKLARPTADTALATFVIFSNDFAMQLSS